MTTPTTRVTPTGARRRLQALRLLGWTNRQLATMTGLDPATIRRTLHPATTRITHNTAIRVKVIYDTHWNRRPRPRTPQERRDTTNGVRYAQAQGWAPAMAWDCIDTDTAPQGVRVGDEAVVPVAEALVLLKAGEAPHEVAQRLGVKPESLARRLRRHGQHRWAAACERKGM